MLDDQASTQEQLVDQFYREMEVIENQRDLGVYTSSTRAARELARRMKQARLLLPYMKATFVLANSGGNTLEIEQSYNASIELISLIENESRRRSIQADYPEGLVETWGEQWRVPCYHLLATAQGRLRGFNSDGMYACIAEGLQVARQTGSPFISSFYEFATDVHIAADDLELAMHHARANAARPLGTNGEDRRWVGARDVMEILHLQGRLTDAYDAALACIQLCASWHSESESYFETIRTFQANLLLSGQATNQATLDEVMSQLGLRPPQEVYAPPPGEDIDHDVIDAQHQALLAAVAGDFESATATLTHWDQLLRDRVPPRWFGIRLRLIAATKMAGNHRRADALAKELQTRATAANDFITLSRLKLLHDDAVPISPVPPAAPYDCGPWALPAPRGSGADASTAETKPAAAASTDANANPLRTARVTQWWDQLKAALQAAIQEDERKQSMSPDADPDAGALQRTKPALEPIVAEVVAAGTGVDAGEAEEMLRLVAFSAEQGCANMSHWTWAQSVVAAYGSPPRLSSLLPLIGDALRRDDTSTLATSLTVEALEAIAKHAMKAAPEAAVVFRRAGQFYLANERTPDAEQCLARAFRLDRTHAWAAGELAQIYTQTERPTAALAVLDLSIRESRPDEIDPLVLWKAGLLAQQVEQYVSSLTYLDRFAEMAPDYPSVQYHRAIALLELKRDNEAQTAIDAEATAVQARMTAEGAPSVEEPLQMLAVRAAIASLRGDRERVTELINQVLTVPLSELGWVPPLQMQRALMRLWTAAGILEAQNAERIRLETVFGLSGLAPVEFWDSLRVSAVPASVGHYVVVLTQPLDPATWKQSPVCLPDQLDWTAYAVVYGVLAASARDAATQAAEWEARLHAIPAIVNHVERQPGRYQDQPGITNRTWPKAAEGSDLEQTWDGEADDSDDTEE